MLVNEVYEKIGGNYEDIKGRLQSDVLIERFLKKFLEEKSYRDLVAAAEANNVEESIFTAHKLKGVAANLSFTNLFQLLTGFLQDLRKEGQTEVNKEIMQQVTEEYQKVIQVLQKM